MDIQDFLASVLWDNLQKTTFMGGIFSNDKLRGLASIVFFLALFSLSEGYAQRDLIRTQAGEDIRCRIIDETPVRFVFAYLKNGKPYRSEIFKNLVASFKFDYYPNDTDGADKLPKPINNRKSDELNSRTTTEPEEKSELNNRKGRQRNGKDEQTFSVTTETTQPNAGAKAPYETQEYRSIDPDVLEKPRLSRQQEYKSATEQSRQVEVPQTVDKPVLQVAAEPLPTVTVDSKPQVQPSSETLPTVTIDDKLVEKTPYEPLFTTGIYDQKATGYNTEEKKNSTQPFGKVKEDSISVTVRPDTLALLTQRNKEGKLVPIDPEIVEINPETLVEGTSTTVTERGGSVAAQGEEVMPGTVLETAPREYTLPPEIAAVQEGTEITETPIIYLPTKWRVGIKAGIGNRLNNATQTTSTYGLYLEELLRGYSVGGDIAYFPRETVGFGLVYTDFRSWRTAEDILYKNIFAGAELMGNIGNKRSLKFIGPALFIRKKLDQGAYVVLGISPGYNFYTDNGNYDAETYTLKGNGFGVASTMGIDFLLGSNAKGSRNVTLSFEAGYSYGKINSLQDKNIGETINTDNSMSINRLDFNIGLRFVHLPRIFKRKVRRVGPLNYGSE